MASRRRLTQKRLESLVGDIAHGLSVENTIGHLEAMGFDGGRTMADALHSIFSHLIVTSRTSAQLAVLLGELLKSPSPTGALVNFQRFMDASGASGAFLNTVAGGKPIREILATIFGSSQYMSDIVIRNPGYLYWLIEKATWEREETLETLRDALRRDVENFSSVPSQLNAARRFHRRMLLKIGVQDLLGQKRLEEITADLSRLADAIAQTVLEIVWGEFDKGTGTPAPPGGLAVLALGKLGGRELNYSSDIDLVYVCADAPPETIEFYRRLAAQFSTALSSITPEGYFYRVDLRLRPDGETGPLVNSLTAMQIYYENRARPWEFQAMLKARAIAGDENIASRLLECISALTFDPTFSYSPVETISLMRKRIRENISSEERIFNIKLMEGGIRDIEFIVQTLQLLHGRTVSELRVSSTMEGIRTARRLGFLKRTEARNLEAAYVFFRLVEHRLQMMHQFKTHSIPSSEAEIRVLAARVSRGPLGRLSYQSFLATLSRHLNTVRALSDRFFDDAEIDETALLLLEGHGERGAASTLSRYGLSDARQATGILRSLAYGSFPNLLDRGTRVSFQKLLPALLDSLSGTAWPNQSLIHFANLAAASRNQRALYEFLHTSPPALAFVRDIVGASSVLARVLSQQLLSIDALLEDPAALLESPLTDEPAWRALIKNRGASAIAANQRRLRELIDRRLLAAWVIDMRSGRFPRALAHTLTATTREIVEGAFDALVTERERTGLFVLGSYGVGEPRPNSDLDVLVVSTEGDPERTTREIQTLNTLFGNVLKIDFRLRGEGANAPLVQTMQFYRTYLVDRVSPWERVAFAKCCHWAGGLQVARDFLAALQRMVTEHPDERTVRALLDTRRKLEGLVTTPTPFETKRSAGGRYDIEYLCAIALARHGGIFPLDAPTHARVGVAVANGDLTEGDRRTFDEALRLFEQVDFLMELQDLGLPRTEAQAADLASYLDRTCEMLRIPVSDVRDCLHAAKADVRAAFNRAFQCL